jgi:hypothetical protein
MIGDIVASRRLGPDRRSEVQKRLLALLDRFNSAFADALAARIAVSSGDEFEGLIRPEFAANAIPDLIWTAENTFPGLDLRFGVGCGVIDTEITREAPSIDGPAFHRARMAIQLAAKKKLLGGVFAGFGAESDTVLNGIARVLSWQRRRWKPQQRRVANLLREGIRRSEVAPMLGISRQAVSLYARNVGWAAYAEGEAAWRTALARAVSSSVDSSVPAVTPRNASEPATIMKLQ